MFYSFLVFTCLSISVYPSLLFVLLASIIVVYLILKFATGAATDALRHDAISRSPINSLFSATLNNLVTIRAYRRERIMNE